jgi:tRNA(fMet)-specific endonuclease VapC
MSRTHLLDTSVYSQLLRPAVPASVTTRWQSLGEGALAIAAICEAELLYGLKKRGADRQLRDYEFMVKGRYDMLGVDAQVAATYAELRVACETAGFSVGDMDLLIAATAKANNLTVATLNYRDFARIPGLAVEDWSQPPASAPPSQ